MELTTILTQEQLVEYLEEPHFCAYIPGATFAGEPVISVGIAGRVVVQSDFRAAINAGEIELSPRTSQIYRRKP